MRHLMLLIVVLGLFVPAGIVRAQEDKQDQDTVTKADAEKADEKKAEEKEEELTLERLFPEKSFFGPSARSTDFSFDGRYCAYLYRPYIERRHSSDLWIYDVETGEARRITSVSVLSKFQEATRKVRDDRIKKAKKKGAGKKDKGKGKEKDKAGDEKATPADDGVSGDWEGTLTDGESLDLPPEGLKFDLSIVVDDQGAVTGTLRTPMNSATITDGKFDKATGSLACTLTDSESGMTASLSASVKDQAMTGTITIAAELLNVTLKLNAERTAALQQEEQQEEQEVEKQQEVDEDAEEQGEDEEVEKTDDAEKQKDEEKEKDLGDVVDEKDADDDKAPRYGGVSTYVWAPEACELIFTSGGDLYRYDVQNDEITRLTMTQEGERGVQYLPDGSGYTFMRGRSVMKVTFGSSLLEQIDPKLPGGEEFSGYRMSPDGKAIAFLTTKGGSSRSAGRQVNIINYRNRFAEVRQVSRHMSDDARPKVERAVYIYDMRDHFEERGVLSKLFTASQNMPRDFVGVAEWSLDSSRVCFSAFDQSTGQVKIFEARLPEEKADDDEDDDDGDEDAGENGADEDAGDDDDGDDNGKNGKADDDSDDEEKREKVAEAKVVYQFFHNGGPNTPPMIRPSYLADNRRIVFISELSGFRQLHVLDPVYEQLEQLTRGRFEIYPERLSKDHKWMFATATKGDPSQRNIYRIDLAEGEMTRLDKVDGTYSTVAVSNDGMHALANFVDYGSLTELVAIDADADEPKVLTDSHPEEAEKLTGPIPEFFTYENRHGQDIHGHMFKPDDWTPQDKRPLLIYVYGGPLGTRKMVTRGSFSSDSYFFAYYLAKKHGYIT